MPTPTRALDNNPERRPHPWKSIKYDNVLSPWGDKKAGFQIASESKYLRLNVSVTVDRIGRPELPGDISAFIHRPDGTIEPPVHGQPKQFGLTFGSGRDQKNGRTNQILPMFFPWGRNLDEAWIEVHLANFRYWIEVPYGFSSDPATAPGEPASQIDIPRAPKSRSFRPGDSTIVQWQEIIYELGAIQNNWRLNVVQFPARSEVLLYREDGPWSTNSPVTSLSCEEAGGAHFRISPSNIVRPDKYRRRDIFEFADLRQKGRGWATLTIQVDQMRCRYYVPTSIIYKGHSHLRK